MLLLFLYMPYTQYTFGDMKQRLANELGDSGKVFFTDHELGRYIIEALHWWGLSTMYFRETGKIDTVANQSFYYIENSLSNGAGTSLLQSLSITDRELINDINYFIMENQISSWAGGWIGTEMFSLQEISSILSDSRDEFLKLTAMIAEGYDVPTNDQRVELPADHIRILRGEVTPSGSAGPLPIWAVDQVELYTTFRETSFPEARRPKAYTVSYSPQLTVDIWPAPNVPTLVGIQGIKSGASLDPQSSATILKIPDDASFLLKYRTIADLLSGDGLARCPQIAQYCEMRYMDGLEAASRYLSVLWQNDGGPRGQITSTAQWDQVRPTWRYTPTGQPRTVAQLNWNTLAVRPLPDDEYTLTFESIRKAPIPTADGDFIQVGRESIQAIYDYAQHIALIKSQGLEFEVTMQRYESAKMMAEEYRQQVASQSYLYQSTQLPSLQEKWFRPLRKKIPVQASAEDRQLVEE
jgi:hypothetical protein